jgi:hypothetical protein
MQLTVPGTSRSPASRFRELVVLSINLLTQLPAPGKAYAAAAARRRSLAAKFGHAFRHALEFTYKIKFH